MDVKADVLIKAYIKIRTARKLLDEQFKSEDAELARQQDMISEKLADLCDMAGVESLKTPFGSATRGIKTRYWTSDWGSMYDFIKEHDAMHLLEQRVHQTNMKTFLDNHPDVHPVGLNVDRRYVITVRSK